MVSVQQETKRGLKTYLLDSLVGLFKKERESGTKAQSAKQGEGELQRHDNLRHQTRSELQYRAF